MPDYTVVFSVNVCIMWDLYRIPEDSMSSLKDIDLYGLIFFADDDLKFLRF